jgi:hypothetical protein
LSNYIINIFVLAEISFIVITNFPAKSSSLIFFFNNNFYLDINTSYFNHFNLSIEVQQHLFT